MTATDSATALTVAALPARGVGDLLSRRISDLQSSAIRDLLAVTSRPEILSLAGGLPDESAMPARWLADTAAEVMTAPGALQYSTTEGHQGLRAVIAQWETAWRGRYVGPDEVIVNTGSQQALDLLGKVLLDPGDDVVVEDPAYVGALQSFALADVRLAAIPQDAAGMRTDLLEQALRAGLRPKFVYLTPTFHNPAGSTLADDRRRHVAALADEFGFLVVEDDAYRELSFDGSAPAPIAAYTDRVVRLGTFSKILAPGLRVGWMTGPVEVLAAAAKAKQATDLHTSTLAQLMLHRAAAETDRLAVHVAGVRRLYAGRAGHLVTALQQTFGDAVEVNSPAGGMFAWARFTDGTDTTPLLQRALAEGVAFVPGPAFSTTGGNRDSARFCFASVPEDRLDEAVARLARAHAG
ncbi:aminotransferase class I/II-fold pyridoxal phosphate-dependent enzyme [Nakamurella sp. YIM 132087]|uniref:Aminotransferase class I/II-fold pyridoxal phosphate-dependent enzyme n=1 Tax=Nakamurella alba TaxID=2665158 RepID=A0A7K1FSH0_9ACTN|nr:PLP-dependent aminotransferase family protein [Nakamurella alba]MTD16339.1 aminotransferase class I/II-fold pyridoxal phosphate-dependent enzyme [Nakamurella alba]